jgi:plastocyanin
MKRLRISILCAVAVLGIGLGTYLVLANDEHAHKKNVSAASADSGPLSNATVSFGSWRTPLDRFTAVPPPSANNHEVTPQIATIKAGGTVNFIISGLHQVIVYDNGTQPGDIDATQLTPPAPPLPQLITDANNRIYRGLDPRPLFPATLDRVEVVNFANPGTYLVICGVLPHFQVGMYGFVKVLP